MRDRTRSRGGASDGLWLSFREGVRSRLWPMPVAGVVLAFGLGLGMVQLDRWADDRAAGVVQALLFGGDADAARAVLDAIASSLITVTSLTFSLTVVTLQLASSQFSPRLLRTFASDGFVQATLAIFLATFVFALTVLRSVRSGRPDGPDTSFVPGLSVTFAFGLTLISVVALVLFLAHLAREIRVERMLQAVHGDTDATIEREMGVLEDSGGTGLIDVPDHARPVVATTSGFLVAVDRSELFGLAERNDSVIWIDRPPGASVVSATPVAFVWSTGGEGDGDSGAQPVRVLDDELAHDIRECLTLSFERSGTMDVSFGLRQITDVAVKALSPGINDPTTATHALGHSAAILGLLAEHDDGPDLLCDDTGRVRVVLVRPRFAEMLELALAQPRHYGAAEPEVHLRSLQLIREVAWRATESHQRTALANELRRTMSAAARQHFDEDTQHKLEVRADSVRDALGGAWRPDRSSY